MGLFSFPLLKMAFVELRSGRFLFPILYLQRTLPCFASTFANGALHGNVLPLISGTLPSPDVKHVLEILSNQHLGPLHRKTLMVVFLLTAMLCPTGTLRIPRHQRAL